MSALKKKLTPPKMPPRERKKTDLDNVLQDLEDLEVCSTPVFRIHLPSRGYGFASAATRASEIRVSFEDVVTVTLSDLAAVDNVFLARAQKLKTLEFLDESPWDGVEDRKKSTDFLSMPEVS
jgi:hypothetical protein